MSLYKRLDKILEAVGKIPELLKTLKGVREELALTQKRMDRVDKGFWNLVMELKERRLLGPDAYPDMPEDIEPFPLPPLPPPYIPGGGVRPWVVPESPGTSMYGVGISLRSTPYWGGTTSTKLTIDTSPPVTVTSSKITPLTYYNDDGS